LGFDIGLQCKRNFVKRFYVKFQFGLELSGVCTVQFWYLPSSENVSSLLWYISKCCDLKTRAPSGQSFTLWQQATIEITWRDHSICLFAPHIYGCYSSCTSRFWWIAHSTHHQPRGCNKSIV